MSLARWLAAAAILLALYFAIQGGEFGTTHLLEIRRDVAREQEQVTQLELVVDSLEQMARAIQHDRRMQERVARESFGMIRKGEHLFRIVPGDSVGPLE